MKKRDQHNVGFWRDKTMKIVVKKAVALQKKTTAIHFPGSVYSLEGCPPAEPSSASLTVQSLHLSTYLTN